MSQIVRTIFAAGRVLCLLAAATGAHAADEYRVKAAFLMNFTKFVDWPPASFSSETSPFSICILGSDPFGAALDSIVDGEAVDSHKLVVHRFGQTPQPGVCQVLFVGGSVRKDLGQILEEVGPGVLTVGEGDNFLLEGGIIAFVIENRRVRFDINQSAATKAELKMNAKLLGVARSVTK